MSSTTFEQQKNISIHLDISTLQIVFEQYQSNYKPFSKNQLNAKPQNKCSLNPFQNHLAISITSKIFKYQSILFYKYQMGASNSILIQKGVLNHPRFRKSTLLQSQGQTYLEVHLTLHSSEAQTFNTISKTLEKFNHQNILVPIQTQLFQSPYCGDAVSLQIIYPFYPFSLQLEIADRRCTNQFFKSNEIWYLLDSLVKVGKQFQREKLLIGNLCPYNILLNSEGQLKIITQYSIPQNQQDIQNKVNGYPAPEQMKVKGATNNKNYSKSEVFSTALTILQAITLCDLKSFYNYNLGIIDLRSINLVLNRVRNFHPLLRYILQKMTIEDPIQRPFFHEISALLNPYSSNIGESEAFTPDVKLSSKNLDLFHACFKNYKSSAFNRIREQLDTAHKQFYSPVRSLSGVKHKSEKLYTPTKHFVKPLMSEANRVGHQAKSSNKYMPLYEQNYYKLKYLKQKSINKCYRMNE